MELNRFIFIPLIAWLIAQLIKFVTKAYQGTLDFKYLYVSGGMPSAHAAVVMALAAETFFAKGHASFEFGISLVLAAIVMYDSFGVRRASGEQAATLNLIIEGLASSRNAMNVQIQKLREILGHTPTEVAGGALLGSFIALLFNTDHIQPQLAFLSGAPIKSEFWAYLGLFGLLTVAGWVTWLWLGRAKWATLKVFQQMRRNLVIKTQIIGIAGLLLSLVQYQTPSSALAWRAWPFTLIIALIAVDWWLIVRYKQLIPAAVAVMQAEERKQRWLKFHQKKKRR